MNPADRAAPHLGHESLERIVAEDDAIRRRQLEGDDRHSLTIVSSPDSSEPVSQSRKAQRLDVVGAGMAGLLAAAMLRKQCSGVYELADELPNNHSAVLRFRGTAVADTLGIPFKAVDALKAVAPWRNPIADALAYSRKTNGSSTLRSVLTADGKMSRRYIAPPDIVGRMAAMVEAPIKFGVSYPFWAESGAGPIISTIPMPSLMRALNYPRLDKIKFESRSGINLIATVKDCDAYCSLYVPDPTFAPARISLTGDQLIAECYGVEAIDEPKRLMAVCAELMGLSPTGLGPLEVRKQKYAKILPIDEGERRRFIMWASDEHGVYSLGRYATWRPGLLLDDVVQDVRVIQRLINDRAESYSHKLKG